MAIASYTREFDDLASTTMELIRSKIADAIFDASPTLKMLNATGAFTTAGGGRHIETRLMYAKNNTVGTYHGYDELVTAPTESITAAKYGWKQAAGAVCISGLEERVNSGPEQLIGLLKHEVKLLSMSFRDWLADQLFATTSAKDFVRDFTGIEQIAEPLTGGSQGTLGGISKATYTWWRNQYATIAYDTLVTAGDTRALYTALTSMVNNTTQQIAPLNDMIMVTSQKVVETFEREDRNYVQWMPKDRTALDLGITAHKFKGISMLWDPRIANTGPTGERVFMLCKSHLNFTVHKAANFSMTPFQRPTNQDAKVAHMLLMGNMTSSNNRHHGCLLITDMA